MDTNYWYYTLSAIPQTLGAIIALSATFVVFKLNFISEKIKDSRTDLRRFILLLTSYQHKEIHDIEPLKDEEFLKLYEEGLNNIKASEDNLGLDVGIYHRLQAELKRIIEEDWKSGFSPRKERIVGYLTMKRDTFKSFLAVRKMSLRLLGWSLVSTTLVIAISLVALPHYNNIGCPVLVVRALMGASIFSIILTSYSVWRIASEDLSKK